MKTRTITVTNPSLRRHWGWGYSTTPTGRDAYEIEMPASPDFTGTIKQILAARSSDRTWKSLRGGGTYTSEAWFYRGQRVVSVEEWGNNTEMHISPLGCELDRSDPDYPEERETEITITVAVKS